MSSWGVGQKIIFFAGGGGGIKFEFWWGFYFRLGTYLMGRVDGNQKCPSIFFRLCEYIEYVYVYVYTKEKLSPIFL